MSNYNNDINENGTSGSILSNNEDRVKKTWEITPTGIGLNADITFQWNSTQQGSSFSSSNAVIKKNIGGVGQAWNGVTSGSVSGSGPFNITATGVATFSKFAVSGDAPLPVELTSFTGTSTKNGNALLTWHTSSELDNEGFSVLKSGDGETFREIAFIYGNGTTNQSQAYEYIDKSFDNSAYYKLNQKDFDGDSNLSKELAVFPNPITDQITIRIPESLRDQNVNLSVISIDGKFVKQFNGSINKSNVEINQFFSQLDKGIYILTFEVQSELIKRIEIIKQ